MRVRFCRDITFSLCKHNILWCKVILFQGNGNGKPEWSEMKEQKPDNFAIFLRWLFLLNTCYRET